MITEGKKKKGEEKTGMCQQGSGPPAQSACRLDLEQRAWHWAPHYRRQIGGVRDVCECDEGAARTELGRKIKSVKYV